ATEAVRSIQKAGSAFEAVLSSGLQVAISATVNGQHWDLQWPIETVAEGVETVEQLNILRGIGCGVAQGFLLAKPMPSEKFLSFVEETTTAERLGA
ncbi:MAG: EAL domain-containing protein, partial [Pseudomonadota bacterium]